MNLALKRQKGSVLILVLIVLSSMTILSVGLAYRTRIEMKLAYANARRTQVYYLALGGIERIKTLISQQELSPQVIAKICQFGSSANEERLFEQLKDFDLPEQTVLIYSLRDEQGYLNINNSDPASWENIGISSQFIAGIVDWIDADDDTSPDGAETDFYEQLEPAYVSKNSPCATLKELLFIREVIPANYLGSLSDASQSDSKPRSPSDNSIGDLGLVNIFTVYGDGKININTASKTILAALPGLDEQAAETILSYRSGPDGRLGTDDDMCFGGTTELSTVEGLTELQIELLGQYCCFDSGYFRIFSYASLDNTYECCLMATVTYTENEPRVLYVERLL